MPATPVLLMTQSLDLGGSERQLTQIARSLDRSRFAPHVGCFRPSGVRARELEAAGVPVVQFPLRSFRGASLLTAARAFKRYLRDHRIRLVHSFDTPSNLFAAPLVRFSRGPAIVLTSQRAHRGLLPAMHRRLLRWTDRIASGIVVNCEFLHRHLIEDESVPAARVHLCCNGVDFAAFQPEPRARPPKLEGARLVIGTLCSFRPEKGLETLLDAFANLAAQDAGLRLLLVGDGPSRDALIARAAALGIRDSVHFEPGVADVAPWLRAMDIFVLPSHSEALSNALMEAMACGCAAIASNVGGNPELIDTETRGLLFSAGDAVALTAALRRLIDEPALREKLAAQGSSFIRDNFSLEAAARRMGEIYDQHLGSAKELA